MQIDERLPMTGTIALKLFEGGRLIQELRHNVVCDGFRSTLIRRALNTASAWETGYPSYIAFGTGNPTVDAGDYHLDNPLAWLELFNQQESGGHLLASAAIGFNDLVTAKTTITTITDATHLVVADSTGFRVGDTIEVNVVDTTGVTTNAQFVEVSAIPDGTHIELAGTGLDLGAAVPPAAGWYVMQIVGEAGLVIDLASTTVDAATDASNFSLASATGFDDAAPRDRVRVQTGASSYAFTAITSLTGTDVVVSPALPATPTVGRTVESAILANHASGFRFRKTSSQVAEATVDITFG